MAETTTIRKAVKAILAKHGFTNKFSVRETSFSDLARDSVKVISIKRWRPSPKAKLIKAEIYKRFSKVIVEF